MPDQMKIYVAGPMESVSGNWNEPLFDFVVERLRKVGCTVFSPCEHARNAFGSIQKIQQLDKKERRTARARLFIEELTWIINEADVVFMLPGWERSPGASAEKAVALAVGKEIREAPNIILPGVQNDEREFDFATRV